MSSFHLLAHLSAPPSVTLPPDPPWFLHCSPRLIDLLHKYFIFFLSSSTLLLCKASRVLSVFLIRDDPIPPTHSCSGRLAGIRALAAVCCQSFQRFSFQTPNTFINATRHVFKHVVQEEHLLLFPATYHFRWLAQLAGGVTFSDFNKVISINKW